MISGPNFKQVAFTGVLMAIWFCHYFFLKNLAERDKHFSHLSSLERELSFRSEMAMYYSYFKDFISTPNFADGLHKVLRDNLTQFPDTVNALQRFNVYPELFTASLYRMYVRLCQVMEWPLMECWQVDRGSGMPTVTSCEGFGEPAYFYTNVIYVLNGFLAVFTFLFGYFLSENSFAGGFIAVACFYFNHREATRVMWAPPLRESFAFPFIVLQNLLLEISLKTGRKRILPLAICNAILLVCWQFSQFAFVTQIYALGILYAFGYFENNLSLLTSFLTCHFAGLLIGSVFLFGNRFLLTSLYTSSLLNFVFMLIGHHHTESLSRNAKLLFRSSLLVAGTFSARHLLIKMVVGGVEDDSHIFDLLRTKLLPAFKTFHTQLYICAPEFDYIGWNSVFALSRTLLIPCVSVLFSGFLYKFMSAKKIEPYLAYHFLQLAAYAVMAIFVMRLKLFFTPFACITMSLFAVAKINAGRWRRLILGVVACIVVFSGAQNLRDEWSLQNEFANWPLESLINFINTKTKPDAAFAGAMPTTAAIRLTTNRPIANHPYYEDVSMRNRTLDVYTIYSRKPLSEVHAIFRNLGVRYVVVETIWCENQRNGCALAELYDLIDPLNRHEEPICVRLIENRAEPYFKLVFQEDPYYLLKVLI